MDKKFDPQFKEFMTGAQVQGINTKKCSFTSYYSLFHVPKRIRIDKSGDYGRKVVSFNKRGILISISAVDVFFLRWVMPQGEGAEEDGEALL